MKIQYSNCIDFKSESAIFRDPSLSFSVSAREIRSGDDIKRYLALYYIYLDQSSITSLYGSTTIPSELYGGRIYSPDKSLSQEQIIAIYNSGRGLSLTLTNHIFSKNTYIKNLPFLERYNRKGNTIICVNDNLARSIKRDFPLYSLRASVIKSIKSVESAKRALELYDDIVIPMDMNDDDDFLISLPCKHRIVLFGNALCAYTCRARVCYKSISAFNSGEETARLCSKKSLKNTSAERYFFNVKKLSAMGFKNFKMVPLNVVLL